MVLLYVLFPPCRPSQYIFGDIPDTQFFTSFFCIFEIADKLTVVVTQNTEVLVPVGACLPIYGSGFGIQRTRPKIIGIGIAILLCCQLEIAGRDRSEERRVGKGW